MCAIYIYIYFNAFVTPHIRIAVALFCDGDDWKGFANSPRLGAVFQIF